MHGKCVVAFSRQELGWPGVSLRTLAVVNDDQRQALRVLNGENVRLNACFLSRHHQAGQA